MKKLISFLLPLLLILSLSSLGWGATYYVDATLGLDAQAGTEAAPWQTVAKVNATCVSGDIIYFKRAESWHENLTMPDNSINYGVYGTGANPFIAQLDENSKTGWTFSDNIDLGPWWYISQMDVVSYPGSLSTGAASTALGYNNIIIASGENGAVYKYASGTW